MDLGFHKLIGTAQKLGGDDDYGGSPIPDFLVLFLG
jgi:hypothetical protein